SSGISNPATNCRAKSSGSPRHVRELAHSRPTGRSECLGHNFTPLHTGINTEVSVMEIALYHVTPTRNVKQSGNTACADSCHQTGSRQEIESVMATAKSMHSSTRRMRFAGLAEWIGNSKDKHREDRCIGIMGNRPCRPVHPGRK